MTITWLSYYTRPAQPGQLETDNEQQAFAIYARWRAWLRWMDRMRDAAHDRRERRATQQALIDLSDDQLRDVGLLRTGNDFMLAAPDPSPRLKQSRYDDLSVRCPVVALEAPLNAATLSELTVQDSSRAA